MAVITHQQVQLGEIELHVAQCGEGEPVLLLHGFPELWYSWRHQMQAIAASRPLVSGLAQRGAWASMPVRSAAALRRPGSIASAR